MDVFENHIEYCIKNNIKDCERDVAKYFCNKKFMIYLIIVMQFFS